MMPTPSRGWRSSPSVGRPTNRSKWQISGLPRRCARDPFFPAARVLRAVTRVLVVLNDRESRGVGLQSLGEAASAFGLDLPARSVLRRIVTGDWPSKLTPSQLAPTAADVLELLRTRLRPALMASLGDLEFVPPHGGVTITPSASGASSGRGPSGRRRGPRALALGVSLRPVPDRRSRGPRRRGRRGVLRVSGRGDGHTGKPARSVSRVRRPPGRARRANARNTCSWRSLHWPRGFAS